MYLPILAFLSLQIMFSELRLILWWRVTY